MTESERTELLLVRRVVTGVAALALLTAPFVHQLHGGITPWVGAANLVVLVVAFAALGRGPWTLAQVIGVTWGLLFLVSLASVARSASAVFAGEADGRWLGTGLLWVTAGVSPVVALAFRPRSVMAMGSGAVGLTGLVVVAAADWQVGAVLRHPALRPVTVDVLVVLTTTVVVAWLARRQADERYRAHLRERAAAARVARLDAEQQRRARLFTRTATQLRVPMDQLVTAADDLGRAQRDALPHLLRRVTALTDVMRLVVSDELDRLVAGFQRDARPQRVLGSDVPSSPGGWQRRRLAAVLVPVAVALVVVDAWLMTGLVGTGGVDPYAVAAGANRMVAVLFVAIAVIVVQVPGARGWYLGTGVLLLHPATLGLLLTPEDRASLAAPYLTAWRLALIAAATLALLAEVIRRRAGERERLDLEAAAAAELASSHERRELLAEQAYGEAAHELKNPLTVISGAAALLQRCLDDGQAQQFDDLVASFMRAVERLDQRLAAMDAAADGVATAHPRLLASVADRPMPVDEVLAGALRAVFDGEAGPPLVDRTSGPATTIVAPTALEHVLENLVGNARKHGDGDTLRIEASDDEEQVVLTVANRGGGLTPHDAERVFEPYWRAAGTGPDVEGVGLGLAIVARLVAGWGGRCRAEVVDGWTRFTVTLPVRREARQPGELVVPRPRG